MTGTIPYRIRAVFFDAVGTVLLPNPNAPEVYAATASRHGLTMAVEEIEKRFREAFYEEEDADRNQGWFTNENREEARWRRIVEKVLSGVGDQERCFQELFEHFSRPSAWQLQQDFTQIPGKLSRRGLMLGIASNFDARLHSVLEGFDELKPLARNVVISSTVGYRKPAREFFQEVIRIANCEANEILFVGDDIINDYEGASRAGLTAILLDERDRFSMVRNRVSSLAELLAAIHPKG